MIKYTTFEFNQECVDDLVFQLINHYPLYVQEPERLKSIINHFEIKDPKFITLIVETDYVDRQYRDSYYSYFSQKYSEFKRNCIRLIFFEGKYKYSDFQGNTSIIDEDIIGIIVLRPLNVGNIGHTLINPQKIDIKGYIQTCNYKIMVCGQKFIINAFPYLSQDNETMSCAETSLYNLIQYYSEKYCEYRIMMPSEILKILENSSYERVLPSHGVDDICMAKVLQSGHFHPRLYPYDIEDGQNFEELFYIYVESGIPFILGLPQHSVICIGHGPVDFEVTNHKLEDIVLCDNTEGYDIYTLSSSQLIDYYIFMDDNHSPYYASTIDELTKLYFENMDYLIEYDWEELEEDIFGSDEDNNLGNNTNEENISYSKEALLKMKKRFDSLLVPLYKRVFLDASRAKSIFDVHFIKNPDFIKKIQESYNDTSWGYSQTNPLVWRIFLASSNSYKNHKCRTANNFDLFEYYSTQSYPRFIWVLEISTLEDFSQKKARVEVLLDATSSRNSDTWAIFSISYKKHLVFVPNIIKTNNDFSEINLETPKEETNPNVTNTLNNKIKTTINPYINILPDDTLTSKNNVSWETINDNVKNRHLMDIFKLLYYNENPFVGDTFDIFVESNLKEI